MGMSLGKGMKGRLLCSGLEFEIVLAPASFSVIRFRFDHDAKNHRPVDVEIPDADLQGAADGITEWGEKEKPNGK